VLTTVALAVALTLSSMLAPGSAPSAQAAGGPRITTLSTAARSLAAVNGQRATRFAFAVRTTDGTGIAASNLARARATCRGCRSVAVAVQIVVAGHVPDLDVAPGPGRSPVVRVSNLAVAEDLARGVRTTSAGGGRRAAMCSRCSTLGLAYQFVVLGRHRLLITPAARARLAQLEGEMRRVAASRASNDVIHARMDALAVQIGETLRTGVVLGPHR
jgi:hypothetical protein